MKAFLMATTYTLAQFEQIDGLLSAVQHRPELEDVAHLGRDATVERFFAPEWELFDALVEVLGLAHCETFASAEDCAADFVTRCLSSASLVEAA